jgi:hypothetical protein
MQESSISFGKEFFQETIRLNTTDRSRLFHEPGGYIGRLQRARLPGLQVFCVFLLRELVTFANDSDQWSSQFRLSVRFTYIL